MEPTNPADRYRSTHWGMGHRREYLVRDDVLDGLKLVEMGKIREVEFRAGRLVTLEFPPSVRNILAFSPKADQRLYILTTKSFRAWCAANLLVDDGPWYPLQEAAEAAGGRQTRWPAAPVDVQVLGRLSRVAYYTQKGGDDEEKAGVTYVHKMGEEGGIEPYLAIDAEGRLWIAGGSYTVPAAGITR